MAPSSRDKDPKPDEFPVENTEQYTVDALRGDPGAEPGPTEVLSVKGTDHVLVRRFRLLVVNGPDSGKAHSSSAAKLVIGSHESADLALEDPAVSRFHCEIVLSGGQAVVRDLGSRNGTLVNGVQILQAPLKSGAMIQVGRSQIRFDLGPDQVRIPLSVRQRFGVLVGSSPAMRGAFALLERAAASDATVLLEGETGTGKEGAAESIHRESARAEGPFVVVDCGAIPSDLLESELFGHGRGAFTGAIAAREGAFEAAAGGTIFLDEIGELGVELQPKLLRFLERREVKRVGQNHYTSVDVRVIAATNRNLRSEVNAKKFRSDLYYRLAVIEIRLPPLRERVEDIPILIESILQKIGAGDRPEAEITRSPDFVNDVCRHPWPGNVRELRNYVERCLALHEKPPLHSEPSVGDEPRIDASMSLREARDSWTRAFERRYLDELLKRHQNNVTAAARAAGVDRIYLYRLLWRHGLR